MRKLRAEEVTFALKIESEHAPVRGNAMASGDDAADKACEDEILARLDNGDEWAWCCIFVEAHWRGFVGEDSLGCCSYADEKDFKAGGYFDGMKAQALDALQAAVEHAVAEGAEIEAALHNDVSDRLRALAAVEREIMKQQKDLRGEVIQPWREKIAEILETAAKAEEQEGSSC